MAIVVSPINLLFSSIMNKPIPTNFANHPNGIGMLNRNKDFSSMTDGEVLEELLVFCIGERFNNDVAWLKRVYDEDNSEAKWEEVRS